MPKRSAVVVATLAASFGALAAGVWASSASRPRPLTATANGRAVTASQGSYCVTARHSGMCADYAYPLRVKHFLDVAQNATVTLKTHDRRVGRLHVSLLHATRHDFHAVGWSRTAGRVPGHPTWRRFHVPVGFGNANRLDLHAIYRHHGGDSDWWAGVKVPRL